MAEFIGAFLARASTRELNGLPWDARRDIIHGCTKSLWMVDVGQLRGVLNEAHSHGRDVEHHAVFRCMYFNLFRGAHNDQNRSSEFVETIESR